MHKVHRYHDICAGHRVTGHEGKCQHLHGHNYRVHFTCEMGTSGRINGNGLDDIGRVVDFSVVKEKLCMWLEDHWDHKFIAWEKDPLIRAVDGAVAKQAISGDGSMGKWKESIVWVPFNPTAENMAHHLVEVIGPSQLAGTGVKLTEVLIEETVKCHASYGV